MDQAEPLDPEPLPEGAELVDSVVLNPSDFDLGEPRLVRLGEHAIVVVRRDGGGFDLYELP